MLLRKADEIFNLLILPDFIQFSTALDLELNFRIS